MREVEQRVGFEEEECSVASEEGVDQAEEVACLAEVGGVRDVLKARGADDEAEEC